MVECKNCKSVVEERFCPKCGQKAKVGELTMGDFVVDACQGFISVNEGFFHTYRGLFTNPGRTIRGYVEGKRIVHYKPLSMVLVLASVYLLLAYVFGIKLDSQVEVSGVDYLKDFSRFDWFRNNLTLNYILDLPVLALISRWIFRKYGYTYTSHLVVTAYATVQRLSMLIVALSFMLIWEDNKSTISTLAFLAGVGLTVWTYAEFFNDRRWFRMLRKQLYIGMLFLLWLLVKYVTIFVLFTVLGL